MSDTIILISFHGAFNSFISFDHYLFYLLQLYPFRIPDLFGTPLIVSGRYSGNFPDIVKVRGFMADMSNCTIDVKARNAKGIPLDKVKILFFNFSFYHGEQIRAVSPLK